MMEIYNKLFETIQSSDLILTPNKHLIGFLHKAFGIYQQRQKKIVWPTLPIFTLEAWIKRQWENQLIQKNIFPYRLLTRNQEWIIWQSIIEQCGTHFFAYKHLARTAQHAWHLNHLWQLNYNSPYFDQTHETRTWKIWAANFKKFSQQQSCIDLTRATTLLIDLFNNKQLQAPSAIFLIGFDEITPLYKKLFQVLKQVGCAISTFIATETKALAYRVPFETTAHELDAMARWAYQSWQQDKKSIVCVLPQLMKLRTQVITIFTEVFTRLHQGTLDPLPFNVAGGKKLTEFPVLQTAFIILQLKTTNLFKKISGLIRSPYLGFAEE
jgi:ATP-dependent helicase/nuclease subunit B